MADAWYTSFQREVARRRLLKKPLRAFLSETLPLDLPHGFRLFVDAHDMTGPSFYVLYGGPAAFYHYEEAEKGEILQALPPGGTFVDAGANIGLFSLFVAKFAPQAKVFAFEPNPKTFSALTQSISANGLSGVTAYRACLGNRPGKVSLHLHSWDSGGHSIDESQLGQGEKRGSIEVEMITLDSFLASGKLHALDVMKIDVQGAEWQVLEGAENCLKKFRPTIVVEIENKTLMDEKKNPLLDLFSRFGLADSTGVRGIGQAQTIPLREVSRLASEVLNRRGEIYSNYVLTRST